MMMMRWREISFAWSKPKNKNLGCRGWRLFLKLRKKHYSVQRNCIRGNPFLKGFIDVACIFSLWWHFLAKNAAGFIPKNILAHSKGATLYYVLKELLCIFSQSGIKQSMATTPNANVIWERFSHHVLRIQHQKKRWWQRVMIFLLLFFLPSHNNVWKSPPKTRILYLWEMRHFWWFANTVPRWIFFFMAAMILQ